MRRTLATRLDCDWFYRRFLKEIDEELGTRTSAAHKDTERQASAGSARLVDGIYAHYGPHGLLARNLADHQRGDLGGRVARPVAAVVSLPLSRAGPGGRVVGVRLRPTRKLPTMRSLGPRRKPNNPCRPIPAPDLHPGLRLRFTPSYRRILPSNVELGSADASFATYSIGLSSSRRSCSSNCGAPPAPPSLYRPSASAALRACSARIFSSTVLSVTSL